MSVTLLFKEEPTYWIEHRSSIGWNPLYEYDSFMDALTVLNDKHESDPSKHYRITESKVVATTHA